MGWWPITSGAVAILSGRTLGTLDGAWTRRRGAGTLHGFTGRGGTEFAGALHSGYGGAAGYGRRIGACRRGIPATRRLRRTHTLPVRTGTVMRTGEKLRPFYRPV